MSNTSTIRITREMIEHLLDLPPGMKIVSDMRIRPSSGEDPAAVSFEVVHEGSDLVEPGKSYSAYYQQHPDTGSVALVELLPR